MEGMACRQMEGMVCNLKGGMEGMKMVCIVGSMGHKELNMACKYRGKMGERMCCIYRGISQVCIHYMFCRGSRNMKKEVGGMVCIRSHGSRGRCTERVCIYSSRQCSTVLVVDTLVT